MKKKRRNKETVKTIIGNIVDLEGRPKAVKDKTATQKHVEETAAAVTIEGAMPIKPNALWPYSPFSVPSPVDLLKGLHRAINNFLWSIDSNIQDLEEGIDIKQRNISQYIKDSDFHGVGDMSEEIRELQAKIQTHKGYRKNFQSLLHQIPKEII